MKRLVLSTLLPLAVAILSASPVKAQTVGVGVGVYSGRGYYGPGFGLYPYSYPGFYGNGISMYGPPVPTYGIVPGTFGAADNRVNQNAPFLPLSVGIYGYRAPSDRYVEPPPLLPREPSDNGTPLSARTIPSTLLIEVRVPNAAAEVFIDGEPTKQSGEVRQFSSPSLPPGENVRYEIRAEWMEQGQKVIQSRITGGRAGERIMVNFNVKVPE